MPLVILTAAAFTPLVWGLNVVPFDISPTEIANGKTHFEQIYDRAVTAMNNAITVFNHANNSTQLLRRQADSEADFQRNVEDTEADFGSRLIESFGLTVIVLPDLAGSLDGHVPDEHVPTSLGGTSIEAIRRMGRSSMTLAIGEHMRGPAETLRRLTDVPYQIFPSLTGLEATDTLVAALMAVSGATVPERVKRQRSRLIDTMLDAHFFFSGRTAAVAAEPDLLVAVTDLLAGMGCTVGCAVTTTNAPAAARVPAERVIVGDLDDLERGAADCDIIFASAHTQTESLPRLFATTRPSPYFL